MFKDNELQLIDYNSYLLRRMSRVLRAVRKHPTSRTLPWGILVKHLFGHVELFVSLSSFATDFFTPSSSSEEGFSDKLEKLSEEFPDSMLYDLGNFNLPNYRRSVSNSALQVLSLMCLNHNPF